MKEELKKQMLTKEEIRTIRAILKKKNDITAEDWSTIADLLLPKSVITFDAVNPGLMADQLPMADGFLQLFTSTGAANDYLDHNPDLCELAGKQSLDLYAVTVAYAMEVAKKHNLPFALDIPVAGEGIFLGYDPENHCFDVFVAREEEEPPFMYAA